MPDYPKRLIEVDLPIKRISAHARREKSIRHGHISMLHIWWARRPLAACRAVICAALWPDPADANCPQAFRDAAASIIVEFAHKVVGKGNIVGQSLLETCSPESLGRWERIVNSGIPLDPTDEAHLNVLRFALLDFVADFANWDNSTVPAYLETARALTQGERRALRRRKLTAEEFAALKRICEENGLLGEQFVLGYERQRLLDANRMDLADRIEWTSQQSVGEGFDITSFNDDGTGRLIEVKATVGTGKTFEMTDLEWRTATAKRGDYFIYRVCNVRARNPSVSIVRDPVALEATGGIRRIPSGWLVTIS